MREMQDRLGEDPQLAAAYGEAHERVPRGALRTGRRPEIHAISAGGMPDRVKCLHVLAGHALAAGPGVNPLGDEALVLISHQWRVDRCTCDAPGAALGAAAHAEH